MALNPEISLGVRPPVIQPLQIQNPLEQFAKVQTLRNLMTQGQLGQLNVQQTHLENQALQEKQRRAQKVADLFAGGTRPTEDQMFAVGGPEAAAAIKALHEADKARFESIETATKAATRAALGIKALPAQQRDFGYRAERAQMIAANPALAAQLPEQYPGDSWLDQQISKGFSTEQYFSNLRADAEEKRRLALHGPELLKKQKEALGEELGIAAQTVPEGQNAWDIWRADLSPELQRRIPAMYSPTAREQVRMLGVKPTAPVPGRDVPLPEAVQKQKVEEAAARANILQTPEKIAQDLDIKRRELEVQAQNNISKAMSGDGAKVYSIASNIQPGLEQLRQAFQRDYNGTLRGIVLGTNPELAKLASNVADQVGRLRSGGAVNPSEEKRFKDQIASRSDLVVGNLGATLSALDRYIAEAKSVADGLKPPQQAAPSPAQGGPKKVKVWNEKTGQFEER